MSVAPRHVCPCVLRPGMCVHVCCVQACVSICVASRHVCPCVLRPGMCIHVCKVPEALLTPKTTHAFSRPFVRTSHRRRQPHIRFCFEVPATEATNTFKVLISEVGITLPSVKNWLLCDDKTPRKNIKLLLRPLNDLCKTTTREHQITAHITWQCFVQ